MRVVLKLTLIFLFLIMSRAMMAAEHDLNIPISLMKLIVSPADHVGKSVSVIGFMSAEQAPGLYVHRDIAHLGDVASSFPIDIRTVPKLLSSCGDRYTLIKGTIIKSRGIYRLGKLEEVLDLDDSKVCWSKSS